jgi:predicted dehydrogenase
MSSNAKPNASRREFLQSTGRVAAATALAGVIVPQVHAADSNTLNIALIGCGGRGTGAAADALSTQSGPIKLIAMADVFPHRLAGSHGSLQQQFGDKMDVPDERKFIGFDGYQKAMDCLRPGDIAIFTTPVAFRWVHFGYAIQKGLNVFMEKPVTTDGPTSKRMLGGMTDGPDPQRILGLADEAKKKNLKVGVGLMCRHCKARGELSKRIKDGEIGDITLLRAYRMHGPVGSCFTGPKPKDSSELLWQIERFHSFLWASGGSYSDFYIHNIDECCWMKDAWPVKAQALGGRHYRGDNVDQNFDTYSVEYTFADGTKLLLDGRNMPGCYDEFASYAHGTKGSAQISVSGHSPAKCRTFKTQNIGNQNDMIWAYGHAEPNPYRVEWEDLVAAIRNDTPYNEVERGVQASLVTSMGRMAAHTGQVITYDQMLGCNHEFAPTVDKLTMDSAAPLVANAQGKYPVPQPGIITKREYA